LGGAGRGMKNISKIYYGKILDYFLQEILEALKKP
jgi:hypothetical protein